MTLRRPTVRVQRRGRSSAALRPARGVALLLALVLALAAPAATAGVDEVPPAPSDVEAVDDVGDVGVVDAGAPARRLKTMVLGIKAQRGADAGLCEALDQVVQGRVARDPGREVLGQQDVASLLEVEAGKQAMGCTEDGCLAELANALDADRVVSGTMDRLGSSWFVVLTELDAREVRVIGRVQKRLSSNEDALFTGVERLAEDLVASGGSQGDTGTLVITTEPPAEVFINGESYGGTPAVVGELPPGAVELELVSGEDRLVVEAPVLYAKATTIDARLSITKGPTAEEIRAAAGKAFWGGVFSIGEILLGVPLVIASPFVGLGSGAAVSLVGGGLGANFFATSLYGVVCLSCGGGTLALGLGLIGLSTSMFIFGPSAPQMGPPMHTVTISPPAGEGEALQLKVNPATGETTEVLAPVDDAAVPASPGTSTLLDVPAHILLADEMAH